MSKDIHLYMGGNDPYVLPIGEVTFHIHTGLPAPDVVLPPPTAPPDAPGPIVIAKPTNLPPVAGAYVLAPETSAEIRNLIDAQPESSFEETSVELGLAINPADQPMQLFAILDGVDSAASDDVTVHLLVEWTS